MAINFNSDRLSSDENHVFYSESIGDDLPAETDVNELINAHANRLNNRYNRLMNYYLGKHSIIRKLAKAKGKPDNRLVINFAKELVDNEVGFFAGTPVKFDYDDNGNENNELDQRIADFVAINDLTDTIAELAKQVDIFGRSYTLLYQDEDSNTRVAPIDPRNAFVIYGTQIGAPIEYAVYYTQRQRNGAISGTLYTKHSVVTFHGSASAGIQYDEVTDNLFTNVPLVEFFDSIERQGLFEQVISLIDAVDMAMSNKGNDIDYFSNTIMKVVNAKIKKETVDEMIDKRLINVPSVDADRPVDIDFLNKPDADLIQEHFLDRAIDAIYTKSNVSNFNDDVFGNASGTALEFKLQSMSNAANMKERKFKLSIRQLFKLAFAIGATLPLDMTGELAKNVKATFKRTVPHNVQDEAKTAKTMLDVVDRKTAISAISTVDDPDAVIKARDDEQRNNANNVYKTLEDVSENDFKGGDK